MFRKFILCSVFVVCLTGSASAQARTETPSAGSISEPVQILRKPQARYTNAARNSDVQGTVTVSVVFLARGEIGEVTVVEETLVGKKLKKLDAKKVKKSGLIEQAINAAKGIEFKPAIENGQPVTVTKTVTYTFTIY